MWKWSWLSKQEYFSCATWTGYNSIRNFGNAFNIAACIFHIKIFSFRKPSLKLNSFDRISVFSWEKVPSFLAFFFSGCFWPHPNWAAFRVLISVLSKKIQIEKFTEEPPKAVAANDTFCISSVLLPLSFNFGLISLSFSLCLASLFFLQHTKTTTENP